MSKNSPVNCVNRRLPPSCPAFGQLKETLLAISLREDPGRTPKMSLEKTILEPQLSLTEAAEVAEDGNLPS